ncbi:uncharacterized protein HKW66_Vig0033380 [Vigna angularis]|uniref:Uncharacterized protein n=1 Tax=Phaseolus angularis TaxID=3914 RepID=A0A8T0L961_PHAAN|nr:uncharacterized protein HKW66_Vig0033380 [Vigna angularis]
MQASSPTYWDKAILLSTLQSKGLYRTVKRRRRDDDQTTGAKAASQPTASQESISNGPAKRTRGKKKNDVCCFDAP